MYSRSSLLGFGVWGLGFIKALIRKQKYMLQRTGGLESGGLVFVSGCFSFKVT